MAPSKCMVDIVLKNEGLKYFEALSRLTKIILEFHMKIIDDVGRPLIYYLF